MPVVRPLACIVCLATLLCAGPATLLCSAARAAGSAVSGPIEVAQQIDQRLAAHWAALKVTPAAASDDATFLRRVSLDLIGRIPTLDEYERFFADDEATRRTNLIRHLLDCPELAIHFARVLDGIIQDAKSGDQQFLTWLERSLNANKAWDVMFREIVLGPWKADDSKAAIRFLDRRTKDLDALTVDSARAFFGVDISCARCHDHPLVEDWKQGHYYGMQAFFNRTTGGKGKISEKKDGEVKFVGADGKELTARPMFLSGAFFEPVVLSTVTDPPASAKEGDQPKAKPDTKTDEKEPIRREQLVALALQDDTFFRRSFVNRMWHWFFGRGPINPVDQMHSHNVPSVPGLLEWLADDFTASGYDVRRLIESIVLTQAWQRDSRWNGSAPLPDGGAFAVSQLRPLTRHQLAESLIIAVSAPVAADESSDEDADKPADLSESTDTESTEAAAPMPGTEAWRRQLAEQAKPLLKYFDPKRSGFESSSGEALFLANSEEIQSRITAHDLYAADSFVSQVIRRVLSREPNSAELEQLRAIAQTKDAAIRKTILWALVSSAEFRFNH